MIMKSTSRNSDFNTDGIVYTSKHLHVSTPSAPAVEPSGATDADPAAVVGAKRKAPAMDGDEELTDAQAHQFYAQGFYVLPRAVSDQPLQQCRRYIDQCWKMWMSEARRPDDWRFHFMLDINPEESDSYDPILRLLACSPVLLCHLSALVGGVLGVFYTQIAVRTPIPSHSKASAPISSAPLKSGSASSPNGSTNTAAGGNASAKVPRCPRLDEWRGRTDYHIDGQANQTGSRFPDYWSVLVGIALNDQVMSNSGNFTVYPGSHTARRWHDYPSLKQRSGKKISEEDRETPAVNIDGEQSGERCRCEQCTSNQVYRLPDIGPPVELSLNRGDAVVVHVLLAHKGGRNVSGGIHSAVIGDGTEHFDEYKDIVNIPRGSREMVFFRVRRSGIAYLEEARSLRVLDDPWVEFEPLLRRLNHSLS